MIKTISYKGSSFNTKHYADIPDEKCEEIKELLLDKPSFDDVVSEIRKFNQGTDVLNDVKKYFFRDLMYKVQLHHSKWSVDDVFHCNDLLRYFYAKAHSNEKFFGGEDVPLKTKIEKCIRNGKPVCSIVSNYPSKTVQNILDKYNINNNYYDFSCGWGIRLAVALRNRVNYYGTDPNTELHKPLIQFSETYKDATKVNTVTDIRCQGSEEFIPEWENKMGLVFTSPPYFALEDYKFGNQSVKEGTTYESWLNNFISGTIKNVKRYLIEDGVLAINIKSYKEFDLYGDTKQVCLDQGFVLVEEKDLSINNRQNLKLHSNDNGEKIMILKKNKSPIVTYNSIDDLFE